MRRVSLTAAWWLGLATVALVLSASPVAARPNYFATFTSLYGLVPGDDIYACGVCHRNWGGTGARNPFGTAIEQQLYTGKTITDSILAVENEDTDLDGFTNVDEITTYSTLPGYSCDNYMLVLDPPSNFQSLITPGVPSCLQPKDILVDPNQAVIVIPVNTVDSAAITISNNGTTFPITVSNYSMVAGSDPTLTAVGPALPLVIPVGGSATIQATFSPTLSAVAFGTLRIESDDPDEPSLDLPITGIGFVKNIAPASERAACFADVERRLETYAQSHMKEWGRCYLDELEGVACDTGRRDLKIAQAQEKLHLFVGGAGDRHCSGAGLAPGRLDLPSLCPAPCQSIGISSISAWADCLVCQQENATNTMLAAAIGSSPPDLPSNLLGPGALRCNRSVVRGVRRAIRRMQKSIGACRLSNITAAVPVDCPVSLAVTIAVESARADESFFYRCTDSTGMQGCLFLPSPNVQCLGSTSAGISTDLTAAVFP